MNLHLSGFFVDTPWKVGENTAKTPTFSGAWSEWKKKNGVIALLEGVLAICLFGKWEEFRKKLPLSAEGK